MPLDTSIPLQSRFAPINYEIQQPINTLMSAMKIKQLGQQNELDALKMQEYERARTEEEGLRNYLSGGREMPAADLSSPDTRTNLLRFGKTGATYAKALTEQDTAALTQKKTAFEVQKAKQEFVAQAQRDTSQNPSDANITAYKEDLIANPLFTQAEKTQMIAGADRILAMPVNERKAFMASQGAKASELKPVISQVNRSGQTDVISTPAFGGAPTTLGNFSDVPLPANVQAQKIDIARQSRPPAQPRAEQPPVAVIDPVTKQAIFVSREEALRNRMQPASNAPALKPLTEGQEIKLRTDVGKDYKAASTALAQMDDLLDSIESVKTAPGLSAATGFTGKYLPSFSEGKAAQAETRLANLRGKVTALGKATAAMSGAIGSIANQEWKILSDQIAALDEVKGKGPLLEQIDLVEQQARGAIARVRDTYEKTRSEDFERFPQFRDLPAPRGKKDSGGGTGGFKYLGKEGG
jgi:hypothetical protein